MAFLPFYCVVPRPARRSYMLEYTPSARNNGTWALLVKEQKFSLCNGLVSRIIAKKIDNPERPLCTGENMGLEIERKFLLKNDSWRAQVRRSTNCAQGYLSFGPPVTVRVRLTPEKAFLCVKGANTGISRQEFEYAIPPEEAEELLLLCQGRLIKKTRHLVDFGGLTWEIDEFFGDNAGLFVAEVELQSPDQEFERPDWLGEEVSGNPAYYNANMARGDLGNAAG